MVVKMKKEISKNRQFLINRLGFIRNRANLSARELSLRLGFSVAYIAKFENGDFSIPAEVLLDAIEICGSSNEEFFAEDIFEYNKTKDAIKSFSKLSDESKSIVKDLIKNMK